VRGSDVSDPAKQVVQVLYPALRYDDARAAIRWLGEAFGFVPTLVVDGDGEQVAHAQLELDGAVLMLGSASESGIYPAKTPRALGGITGSVYAYVADPDAHCNRARAAGAKIASEPAATEYGSREYSAVDPEGYWWTFGTYRP